MGAFCVRVAVGPKAARHAHPSRLRDAPLVLFCASPPVERHHIEQLWLRVLLGTVQEAASRYRLCRVHRLLSQFDVLDDALLVDKERRALCQFIAGVPNLLVANRNSVLLEYLPILIAQKWKVNINLAGECSVRSWAIVADSENYGV